MPNEDFIYYGDSKNAPYGVKDREKIRELTFHVVENLMKRGIKGLAVACNTATSAAVKDLRLMYPDLPLVGIEPAIKPAVSQRNFTICSDCIKSRRISFPCHVRD